METRKVISFVLWGQQPKYCIGAIRNAELLSSVYPGWEAVFQLDFSVPQTIEDKLREFDNVHVIRRLDSDTRGCAVGSWRSMLWRFEVIDESEVSAMISRDCDSRLNVREAAAVEQWLISDKGFHIMRDHPWHGSQILGGMFGIKSGCLPEFTKIMNHWLSINTKNEWQVDQDFLNQEIYPRVAHKAMVHDDFFVLERHSRPFPTERVGLEFVGQVFEADGSTPADHQAILKQILQERGKL